MLAMMFKLPFITLLSYTVFLLACVGIVNPLCLPCQSAYGKRSNPIQDPEFYEELDLRTVYNPHITSPHAGTRWIMGSRVTVTWNASDEPPDATNKKGRIVLGYLNDGDENEHLNYDHPLADGFEISKGSVEVTVPQVEPRNNYIIVLFGDSGNRSQKFTIVRS